MSPSPPPINITLPPNWIRPCFHCMAFEHLLWGSYFSIILTVCLVAVGCALSIVMILVFRERELRNWAHNMLVAIAIFDIIDLICSGMDKVMEPIFCFLPGVFHWFMGIFMGIWVMGEVFSHFCAAFLTTTLIWALFGATYSKAVRDFISNTRHPVLKVVGLFSLLGVVLSIIIVIAVRPVPCWDSFLERRSTEFLIDIFSDSMSAQVHRLYNKVVESILFVTVVVLAPVVIVLSRTGKKTMDLSTQGVMLRQICLIILISAAMRLFGIVYYILVDHFLVANYLREMMIRFARYGGSAYINMGVIIKFLVFWFTSEKFRMVYKSLGPNKGANDDDEDKAGSSKVAYENLEEDSKEVTVEL